MKHLSQKESIALIMDLPGKKRRENIEGHLKICIKCREQHERLLPIMTPYISNKAVIQPSLKSRILSSAALERGKEHKEVKSIEIIPLLLRRPWLYVQSAVAIVFIAAVIISIASINPTPRTLLLQVASIYGSANINAMPAKLHDPVCSGNTISTEDDSVMMLKLSRDYKIMILRKSYITIDKAKFDKNKNIELRYTVERGTLLNKHNQEGNSARYAFITPHALINAENADLLLQTSKNSSNILLMKGKLEIQDRNSSSKTTINSPGRYVVSDGIRRSGEIDSAMNTIQEINEALNSPDDMAEAIISHDYPSTDKSINEVIKNAENELFVNDNVSHTSEQ